MTQGNFHKAIEWLGFFIQLLVKSGAAYKKGSDLQAALTSHWR
jgi:hypothetical protein